MQRLETVGLITCRQVAAGAGLGALAALEVEGLNSREQFLVITEIRRGQLIEIAAVGRLFLWQAVYQAELRLEPAETKGFRPIP